MHNEDPDLHPAGNGNLSKAVRKDSVASCFTKTSLGAAIGPRVSRGEARRGGKSSGEPRTGPRSVGRGLRVRRGKGTGGLDQKSQ